LADTAGHSLRFYRLLSRGLAWLAPWHLRRRVARGREDPARWREKLGQAGVARPKGRLVWLHGVGVGEVMALRGVIAALGRADPQLQFLVTSSARSSAQVVAANLPVRTIHQYLPLDAPGFVARFLDHWRPDLSIWSDQEMWPNAVLQADRRGIPLVFLNARITAQSLDKRRWIKGLYGDLLKRFQLVLAQDPSSATRLAALGAPDPQVSPSIKAAAPLLTADVAALTGMEAAFRGRHVWTAASTHLEDEAVALVAQQHLYAADPRWLLVLVPRDPARHLAMEVPFARRSAGQDLGDRPVYLADTFGELGLWYRLSTAALIGGSFGAVQGHNPWEAAALGCAVLHGPNISNFTKDYNILHDEAGARQVADAAALIAALTDPDLPRMARRGHAVTRAAPGLDGLADHLLRMMA
jgi:3-deoxy-D-manno-octulosonic-acid transferase